MVRARYLFYSSSCLHILCISYLTGPLVSPIQRMLLLSGSSSSMIVTEGLSKLLAVKSFVNWGLGSECDLRIYYPFCTKLCGYTYHKQQEQQNIVVFLGHHDIKTNLHCPAVICCPWCLKQTCLPFKEDGIMWCLFYVCLSSLLDLFRRALR